MSVPQQDGNCQTHLPSPCSRAVRQGSTEGDKLRRLAREPTARLQDHRDLRPRLYTDYVRPVLAPQRPAAWSLRQIVGQFDLFVFQTPCQFRPHIQGSRNAIGQQSKCEISKTGVFATSRRPFKARSPRQRRLTSERESGSPPWFAPASAALAASRVVRRHSHHPCPPRSTASTIRHAAFSMPICELIMM